MTIGPTITITTTLTGMCTDLAAITTIPEAPHTALAGPARLSVPVRATA